MLQRAKAFSIPEFHLHWITKAKMLWQPCGSRGPYTVLCPWMSDTSSPDSSLSGWTRQRSWQPNPLSRRGRWGNNSLTQISTTHFLFQWLNVLPSPAGSSKGCQYLPFPSVWTTLSNTNTCNYIYYVYLYIHITHANSIYRGSKSFTLPGFSSVLKLVRVNIQLELGICCINN